MTRNKWARIATKWLLLLLLPLLGFGAVKGYYWYQVRSVVEQLGQQLSPFVSLEYGAIETGFNGVAGVRQLLLTPRSQQQDVQQPGVPTHGIRIDALRVKASSWLDLVRMRSQLEQGELPQALSLEMRGIQVDLSSAGWEALTSQAGGHEGSREKGAEQGLRGCETATGGLKGQQWLQQLGYQQLLLDVAAEYSFDRSSKLLTLTLKQSLQDQYELELSAALDLGINEFNRYNLTLISPSLGDINVHYQDRSLIKRAIRFCAEAGQETAEQFVSRHVALVAADSLELGLVLPASLLEGYQQFLLGAGQLHVELLGGSQLWPASMLQYSPERLLEALAPKLQINGQRLEPLALRWQSSAAVDEPLQQRLRNSVEVFTALLQAPFVEPQPAIVTGVDPRLLVPSASQVQGRSYQRTELDRLQGYLGADIRIETHNGNLVEGRLLAVEAYELRIYQQLGTGDAVLPIIFKHVAAVQVYR